MANSSILGGTSAPTHAAGKDADALGPSDTSDSGSDVQGEQAMTTSPDNAGEWGALPIDGGAGSDSSGTGERGSATGDGADEAADILPDSVIAGIATDDESDIDEDADDEDQP